MCVCACPVKLLSLYVLKCAWTCRIHCAEHCLPFVIVIVALWHPRSSWSVSQSVSLVGLAGLQFIWSVLLPGTILGHTRHVADAWIMRFGCFWSFLPAQCGFIFSPKVWNFLLSLQWCNLRQVAQIFYFIWCRLEFYIEFCNTISIYLVFTSKHVLAYRLGSSFQSIQLLLSS